MSTKKRQFEKIGTCPERGPRGTLTCDRKVMHPDTHRDSTTGAFWRHPELPHGIKHKRGEG